MGLEGLLENTPEAYYWIGFIMADGCLRETKTTKCLSVSSCIQDGYHLMKLSKFINVKIKEFMAKPNRLVKTFRSMVQFQKCNCVIVPKIMKKFNFNFRKTYNPPLKLNIKQNDLFLSFLIGFIDGDGSISGKNKENSRALYIECHSSWKNVLQNWITRAWKIGKFGYKNMPIAYFRQAHGSVVIRTSQWKFLWFLKDKALKLKLPVLKRKWDKIKNINLKYKSLKVQ